MRRENLLIIASSEKDADLYYATKFIAPDAFAFARIRGKKYILVSDLEIDRAKKEACVDQVLSTSRLASEYKQKYGKPPSFADLVLYFLKKQKVKRLTVPGSFPVRYYEPLKRAGLKICCKHGIFFEKRLIKDRFEIAAIKQALRATEKAAHEAIRILERSAIRKDKLYFRGKVLTSEFLRKVIHQTLLEEGCAGEHTIVSCGRHSIDPHDRGSGPLRAHQPIVMDIFPRSEKTLYYADFTRTVVRGKASTKLKKMYAAVRKGQEIAFKMLRAGTRAKKVHEAIRTYFTQVGFNTGLRKGRMQGFFHSTGHGLGLDVHEPPRISVGDDILSSGQIVTVEPGLYYQGVGGVRLEDVVLITKTGCVNLTKFPKKLEV
ncbi:MAG TPA: Xaa-Pro peptidase family protein [Candidatus Omnitrophota bacterium]|nr:Xaa-Pro peptidase family protein [Candidatus Omnitrophota bacterium]HRY85010.1 Xaa-Pro peptidase family protein [Candidatus Omnitrophota bacterium]